MNQVLKDSVGRKIGEIQDLGTKQVIKDDRGHVLGEYDGKVTKDNRGHKIGEGNLLTTLLPR